jgi:shikimate kinase
VGLPGTGKTTVAEQVASHFNLEFCDTDEVIAELVGSSPAHYLRTQGEQSFRDREHEALIAALAKDAVVATGGGIVTLARSRTLLSQETTFWLDCPDEQLAMRVTEGERPLLGDAPLEALVRLRAERSQWYEEVSRVRIDASGTLEDVVALVLDEIRKVPR